MTKKLPGGFAFVIATALLLFSAAITSAGSFSTTNFMVTAQDDETARRVARCAEYWRRELAIQWLGQELPNWYRPCPITVKVGQVGASGQTTFTFENGEVHSWKMHVQGSMERILDSVVPHEVNHTIFASYFRRPLPRWADEGAATLVEHESEQARQDELIRQVFNTARKIPLRSLLTIREYPTDMRDVLTLYAEGYSLARFLVDQKGAEGRTIYLKFLQDAHTSGWEAAIRQNYPYQGIQDLEQHWSQWITAGSPSLLPNKASEGQLAQQSVMPPAQQNPRQQNAVQQEVAREIAAAAPVDPETIYRSQSPAPGPAPEQATAASNASSNSAATSSMAAYASGAPIRAIPRALRGAQEDNASNSRLEAHNGGPAGNVSRSLRDRDPNTQESNEHLLTPTTEGIRTDMNASAYQFPSARK